MDPSDKTEANSTTGPEFTPEEIAVLRWTERVRDSMRISVQTHCNQILPPDSKVRYDVEKTFFRCLDNLNRLIDHDYSGYDREG